MKLECPECKSPIVDERQNACNRCGRDFRNYYESIRAEKQRNDAATEVRDKIDMDLDSARSVGQRAALFILLPSGEVVNREIKGVETHIGKRPDNDIVIEDPAVSASHVLIRMEGGEYSINDTGSRNGTLVNGKRITEPYKLKHRDVIRLGFSRMTFQLGGYSETIDVQAMMSVGVIEEMRRRTETATAAREVNDTPSIFELIVQPGGFHPFIKVLDKATHTIRGTIFRMDDPLILDALRAAIARRVRVQILVAPKSKGWTKRNLQLVKDLTNLGAEVATPQSTSEEIKLYHYKIVTIDDQISVVASFNPTVENLHYGRDFALIVRDPEVAAELNGLFNADWTGQNFQPEPSDLVISPYNSRSKLTDLLSSAKRSIRIMDAKVEDEKVIELLRKKSLEGCSVKIIGRENYKSAALPKFEIRKQARYKLHAKMMVVDSHRFFIGSQNLRQVGFDRRREVGILIEDVNIARQLENIFDNDWLNTTTPDS